MDLSKSLCIICLRIKIISMLTNSGSVGKSTLKLSDGIKCVSGTENGTRNTDRSKTLSNAKNKAKKIIIARGTKLKRKLSSLISIQALVTINKKERA